ncbi:hypothetical protein ES703_00393 [subsurface metagenome]
MRVIVTLTIDGTKETRFEGDSAIFGDGIDYKKGFDSRLRDIGFWLSDWRYSGRSGPPHKSRVFVPWGSALYIEELVP